MRDPLKIFKSNALSDVADDQSLYPNNEIDAKSNGQGGPSPDSRNESTPSEPLQSLERAVQDNDGSDDSWELQLDPTESRKVSEKVESNSYNLPSAVQFPVLPLSRSPEQSPSVQRNPNQLRIKNVLAAERKLFDKKLFEKEKIIVTLRQDYAAINKTLDDIQKEKSSLLELTKSLQSENQIFKDRNARLLEEVSASREMIRTLREEMTSLRDTSQSYKFRETIVELEKQNEQRNAELLFERDRNSNLLDVEKKSRALNFALENEVQRLKEQNAGLRLDNDKIREYIITKEKELQQAFEDEDYYIECLEELKSDVELWSAKQGKSRASELSTSQELQLLELLAALGPCGKNSVELFESNHFFQKWHSRPRWRIQLLRHVLAVGLFDQIFEPFVAGIPPESLSQFLGIFVISHGSLL